MDQAFIDEVNDLLTWMDRRTTLLPTPRAQRAQKKDLERLRQMIAAESRVTAPAPYRLRCARCNGEGFIVRGANCSQCDGAGFVWAN